MPPVASLVQAVTQHHQLLTSQIQLLPPVNPELLVLLLVQQRLLLRCLHELLP
jgi:hypothetical protein